MFIFVLGSTSLLRLMFKIGNHQHGHVNPCDRICYILPVCPDL